MNRKFILMLGWCILFVMGCSQKEQELNIDRNLVQLHTGEEMEIVANMPAEWSCDNEFIASVDEHGVVRGEHVGTAVVTAASGDERKECKVEVLPRYGTFIEPAYELFLKPVSLLDEVETRELIGREDNTIRYKGEKPYIKEVEYIFTVNEVSKEEILLRANVIIADTDESRKKDLLAFLSERHHRQLYGDDAWIFF